jgi:hypothetical protein
MATVRSSCADKSPNTFLQSIERQEHEVVVRNKLAFVCMSAEVAAPATTMEGISATVELGTSQTNMQAPGGRLSRPVKNAILVDTKTHYATFCKPYHPQAHQRRMDRKPWPAVHMLLLSEFGPQRELTRHRLHVLGTTSTSCFSKLSTA